MSTPSIRASTYSCAHPLINGENAARLQSARTFDPALNIVSNATRSANDHHAGRPAPLNSDNGLGTYGSKAGFAGLNPSDWILLTSGLRQVEFREHYPNTTFYDTIGGANRSNWLSQFAGKSGTTCAVFNGPDSYTSAPQQNNCLGQPTSVDRRNYLRALNQVYRQGQY
jgi:hypothetical protein